MGKTWGFLKRWGYDEGQKESIAVAVHSVATMIAEMRPSIDGQEASSAANGWPVGGNPEA